MQQPSDTVVHLTIYRNEIELAVGTGVLYKKNEKSYIITAWHNVSGRDSETLKCLNPNAAIPNKIIATIPLQVINGESHLSTKISISIPLEENNTPIYYTHSQGWPKVDVVAIPIDLGKQYLMEGKLVDGAKITHPITLKSMFSFGVSADIVHVQDLEFKYQNINDYSDYLYASEDIFIIGYPRGITDYTGQPIWKRATVATDPSLGWHKQEQFLVDCASKEGMSGAPVFFHSVHGHVRLGGTQIMSNGSITIFHGIYVGRIGSTSEFEAQVGRVWKKKIIDEIIDNAQAHYLPDELLLSESAILEIIKTNWPKDKEKYAEDILKPESILSKVFLNTIMEKINGKANYQEVETDIIEFAKKLVDQSTLVNMTKEV